MNHSISGTFILFATAFAIAAFYFIRRPLLAALASLFATLPVLVFVYVAGSPPPDGTVLLVADGLVILLVGAASALIRSRKRRNLRTNWAAQTKSHAAPEPGISKPDSASLNHNVRIGGVLFKLQQEDAPTIELGPNELGPESQPVIADKPETPEPLEEPQYIYQPNDPFRSSIDEAHAIASINTSHRPWVRITWFILFVIGPLVYAELFALATALRQTSTEAWKTFVVVNVVAFPAWLLYFSIWRRKVQRAGKR